MKGILVFLLFAFSFQLLQAQSTTNKTKVKKVRTHSNGGFTIPIGKAEDSLFATFSKGTEESQLEEYSHDLIWLGKTSYGENRYNEVVITFSKPLTYVSLDLSHFNNDGAGSEKVYNFTIVGKQEQDLTFSSSFNWLTGTKAGLDSSTFGTTKLTNDNHSIMAEKGFYGADASGRLIISNPKGITKIIFAQRMLWGSPNGIYIGTSMSYGIGSKNDDIEISKDSTVTTQLEVNSDSLIEDQEEALGDEDEIQESSTIPQNKVLPNDNSEQKSVKLTSNTQPINEPPPSKKNIIKRIKYLSHSKGYSFNLCTEDEPLNVTYYKGKEETLLSLRNNRYVWLGEFNPMEDYSPIIISLSRPVTSVTISMSDFNNNTYGSEQIQNFRFIDDKLTDISSSAKLSWTSNNVGTTTFNEKNQVVMATEGSAGPTASGKLIVTSSTPFTYISFTHKVNRGTPNGVYINLTCDCPKDSNTSIALNTAKIKTNEETKSEVINQTVVDTLTQLKELPPIVTDSVVISDNVKEKEIETASIVKKQASIVSPKKEVIKETPKKVSTPVNKAPIKKSPVKPVAKAPAKKTPPKPTVKPAVKKPVVKSTPKKVAPVKPPAPKTSATKKPVVSDKTIKKNINKSHKEDKEVKKTKPVKKQPYTLSHIAKLKVGDKIKLERVFFKQSLPELLPESYSQLDTLIIILNQYPKLHIELQGFTDNVGNPGKNQILSEQRVTMVKNYLVSKGIAPERLSLRGYGGTDLVTEDTSEEGRKLNRRVEFLITNK